MFAKTGGMGLTEVDRATVPKRRAAAMVEEQQRKKPKATTEQADSQRMPPPIQKKVRKIIVGESQKWQISALAPVREDKAAASDRLTMVGRDGRLIAKAKKERKSRSGCSAGETEPTTDAEGGATEKKRRNVQRRRIPRAHKTEAIAIKPREGMSHEELCKKVTLTKGQRRGFKVSEKRETEISWSSWMPKHSCSLLRNWWRRRSEVVCGR